MDSQKKVEQKGGSMRLGAYPCALKTGSKAREIYGKAQISERHRHRFEVNNAYREQLEKAGLLFSGTSPDNSLAEIIEIKDHPWFIGVQFHPEFQSTPKIPHPLFTSFVAAALSAKEKSAVVVEKGGEKRSSGGKSQSGVSATPARQELSNPVTRN
jgi:CTP synthase